MGRLFWKAFVATWVILLLSASATFFAVHLYRSSDGGARRDFGPPGQRMEREMAASVLRESGSAALTAMLRQTGSSMTVLGPDGQDLLGRPGHGPERTSAGEPPARPGPAFDPRPNARQDEGPRFGPPPLEVTTSEGTFRIYHNDGPPDAMHDNGPPFGGPLGGPHGPLPWEPLAFGLVASLLMSLLVAWYTARPIRRLRAAFAGMAAGDLTTRVGLLSRTGDEIAGLGLEFDAMASKLQNLVQGQRHLLHVLSHELRSPLNRMHVAMGIARQDEAKLDAMMTRMERELTRLDGLIEAILTLSRINSGVDSTPEVMLDLGELIAEIVQDASFEADTTGCTVRLEEGVLPRLLGRPRLLSMAVENVVRNAIRYAPPKSVVEVRVTTAAGWITVSIRDHGPGVPDTDVGTMFEPFQRGAGSTNQDGYGLGLAIAKGAVGMHEGQISARNIIDGGLCVEIRLPVRTAAE